ICRVGSQFSDVFHAVATGAVDFQNIQAPSFGDLEAGVALAARCGGRTFYTIKCLREDSCGRGFPDATRTDKKIGLGHSPRDNGVLQGARDVLLSDDLFECLRPVLPRKDSVTHITSIDRQPDFGSW